MKIIDALKSKKYDFEKFGMSDEYIVEALGFENIADECVEDLQTYINELKWDNDAEMALLKEEFGF